MQGHRVVELLFTEAAIDKVGTRQISMDEVAQIPRNAHITVRNPRSQSDQAQRLLLIGETDGGRALTVVIERTGDPISWLVITAWNATQAERNLLHRSV